MLDKTQKTINDKTVPGAGQLAKTSVVIQAPNFDVAKVRLVGTAPYVQNKMSSRVIEGMRAAQVEGQAAKNKKKREPKDFDRIYRESIHFSEGVGKDRWEGIPASSFRGAMISACRLVNFHMSKAKLTIFIDADGFDVDDGQPLVKIIGKHEPLEMAVRLPNGSTDIACRPIWRRWHTDVTIRWDKDQFSATDVMNLLMRAGMQVGIGSGRPDSRTSNGMGWGTFEVRT